MRIALASYEEHYSGTFGRKVRDVITRFGGPHGIVLRPDTKAKNEWTIQGHDGGMVCKGVHGALTGRAADLLILDDVLKNAEQAQSQTILESQWDWYATVAYSRLGPKAPIVMVTTRWCKGDLPGRIYAEAKETGEIWKVLKFKAIAGDNDPLGRRPGEALWPERVPLERLERIRQKRGRWFNACWQQEPDDEQGLLFRPRKTADNKGWPIYTNLGDAFAIPRGISREIILHTDCTIIIFVDWAMGKKKESDFTAMVVAALTLCGKLLILDCVNERIRLEDNGRRLNELCQQYRPHIVAGDDDMLAEAMVLECRRHRWIPEIRRLPISGKAKIIRAQAGIIRGENGLIYLPASASWLDMTMDALSSFTGIDDEHDDIADGFGGLGRIADDLKGDGREEPMPTIFEPARNLFG
jgi:phage terminase large subunit-like protein